MTKDLDALLMLRAHTIIERLDRIDAKNCDLEDDNDNDNDYEESVQDQTELVVKTICHHCGNITLLEQL